MIVQSCNKNYLTSDGLSRPLLDGYTATRCGQVFNACREPASLSQDLDFQRSNQTELNLSL